jgi:hypothetical protein
MHLFKDPGYVAAMLSLSIGASVYYSQAIIWPGMAVNVYSEGRLMWAGWVSTIVGLGITVGEMFGGALAKLIGKTKLQCIAVMALGTLLLGRKSKPFPHFLNCMILICRLLVMAVNNVDSPKTAMAIEFLATFFIGWNEAIVFPICSMRIADQQEIGTAVGFAGSARSAISTVASTIYTVVLTSRVTKTLTTDVPAAVISAGLPPGSVAGYMEAVAAGGTATALAAVKGLTPAIEKAGTLAYRVAYMDAYRTVFYTSIAFGGIGIIISFFIPNVDQQMKASAIAATLHVKGTEHPTEHEKTEHAV